MQIVTITVSVVRVHAGANHFEPLAAVATTCMFTNSLALGSFFLPAQEVPKEIPENTPNETPKEMPQDFPREFRLIVSLDVAGLGEIRRSFG